MIALQRPRVMASLALLFLFLPSAAQEPTLDARRAAILDLAERFAAVEWTAEERHFFHGEDESGVRVDTPDTAVDAAGFRVGEGNVGMPYCWGGFTSLEEFEDRLAQELWAGHVPNRGNARSSDKTIGVDCSGLVSRCWNLPLKQSTRSLGSLSYELADYDELLPGDIVNRYDAHVAIFTGWADAEHTRANVIEAARLRVEHSVYEVSALRKNEFKPMRYKPLDERWWPMPAAHVENASVERGSFEATGVAEACDAPLPARLRGGELRVGEWARYRAVERELSGPEVIATWMSVSASPDSLTLQRRLAVGEETLDTGATLRRTAAWAEWISAFASFPEPLRDFEVEQCQQVTGTYRLGEQSFPARRVTARIVGQQLSRSTLYPITLELECVVSDEVPVFGICEARVQLETFYGMQGEDRVIGRADHRYELIEFAGE